MKLLLALALFVTSATAVAQTEGARISGRVTDVSGAVIAGSACETRRTDSRPKVDHASVRCDDRELMVRPAGGSRLRRDMNLERICASGRSAISISTGILTIEGHERVGRCRVKDRVRVIVLSRLVDAYRPGLTAWELVCDNGGAIGRDLGIGRYGGVKDRRRSERHE